MKQETKITKLYLKNFKSYQDKMHCAEFGNKITLIYGKNSAGKSTLIQSLRLIQQSNKYRNDLYLRAPDTDNGRIDFPNFHSILPQKNKSHTLSLGIEVKELSGEDRSPSIRKIIKSFKEIKSNYIIADSIDLYAPSEKKRDKTPNLEKFLSVKNKSIFDKFDKFRDILLSEITFSENEGIFYELFDAFKKNKIILIKKLTEVQNFKNKFNDKIKKIKRIEEKKIKSKSDQNILDTLNDEMDELFNYESGNSFLPQLFIFSNEQIDLYKKFFSKNKISEKDFVKFVSEDEKKRKYIYNNNALIKYKSNSLRRLRDEKKMNTEEEKYLEKDILGRNGSTLKEFLCFVLSMPYSKYPSKFTLNINKETQKSIAPESMFMSCANPIDDALKNTRIFSGKVQVPEQFSAGLDDDKFIGFDYENLHQVCKKNYSEINKIFKEFGFDFKIKINEMGSGLTELSFQKKGFSINVGNGGLGAENILPIVAQCVASNSEILYFEEPERRAHPKLQADMSNLFVESSNDKNKNQLIIETHSENLLLGILKNIREKKISHNDVKIIYVYMEDGKSNIQQIDIDEKGRFKQVWKDGFFNERIDLV